MTSTTPKQRRPNVYGLHGQPIATISQSRSTYLSSLLAECEHGHIHILPDDLADWLADDAVCPRCRLLGLTEKSQR